MKKKLLLFAFCGLSSIVANAQYCGGGPTSTIDTNLGSASLTGETSSISYTGCPGVTGIENQLGEMADLTISGDYTLNLTWSTCGGSYSWAGTAWIDFDGSGTYDSDEIVAAQTGSGAMSPTAYPFTVPADATEGTTRMRVMQRESGSLPLDPCGTFSWGSAVEFTINLNPSCEPMVVTASATEVCEGEEITLDAEGIGEITWDGGVTDEVPFLPGAPGTYTYTPTSDDEGDCEAEPVEITVIGLPTVIAGSGDLNYCVGESVTLSAAGDAHIFIWNDGEPMDLEPPVGTHTYSLWGAYTEGGCLGETTDEVTITVHDLPTITAISDAAVICKGDYVFLSATGGVSYIWENPDVTVGEPYFPGPIGIESFTVMGTDANGCSNSSTVDVEVVELVAISGTTMNEMAGSDGEINITITGGAPSYTFDWDNDGTGDFDDPEDLTGLTAGTYTVTVQSDAGCGNEATFIIDSELGIDNSVIANVSIYPNPTSNNVTIELEGKFNFSILDINGKILLTETAKDKKNVSLVDFAKGIYFINVQAANSNATYKIVKN